MSLTALQILQQFSLVDFTTYSNTASVNGRSVIGGAITSTTSTGFYANPNGVSSQFDALTVYGNVSGSAQVDDGGSAYVGGAGGNELTFSGGGAIDPTAPPETESQIRTTVSQFSTSLAGLAANSTVNFSNPYDAILIASPVDGVATFTLSETKLSTARMLFLQANGASTIVINVTGAQTANLSSILFDSSVTAKAANIIWNFSAATNINTSNWQGTILAPNATLTTTGQVNGDVLADAVVGGGVITSTGFAGTNPVCFVAGTKLLTDRGEVAVEHLRPGDQVATQGKAQIELKPVKWTGRRHIDLSRHPRPSAMVPVRIRRGAFADDVPHRDLLLSQDHAIFVLGKLVAARQLINGSTIHLVPDIDQVTYCHIELEQHGILVAEGLPTESYLDTGNRAFFANGAEATTLHPDLPNVRVQASREIASCAPFVTDEADVRPIWSRLADRAAGFGLLVREPAVTAEPELHLVVGDQKLWPISTIRGVHQFVVPSTADRVRLVSHAAAPTDVRPWLEDRRRLGVYVESITFRTAHEMHDIPLDHPALAAGWWDLEHHGQSLRRWTNGDATLRLPPVDGSAILEVRATACGIGYPLPDDQVRRAA